MENLREIFQIMTRRFGLLDKNCCVAGGVDISLVQSHIIYEIDRKHNPSIQQVADGLAMDITTFSRQVQSLVKMGLVQKTPLPEDRRIYILNLTTQGKYIATVIDKQMNDYLIEVFSHMSEFERDMVINAIKLLNSSMEKSSVCCTPLG
ncbi:MarR family winged helix-turn-helix transcriptional regulator [Paenibacillus sp. MMS20-IR301]|uniref:MarR family winged helix-turn-helix transcriptional regulator n=1 Tax=Paenibacillus sp. MMS20-IR301 TaxID=2895946 RepID=UPI0028EF1877|nr:MarR family winged helix-turn-helix transcriptional regulator [Paenibacillus sp. MMS20-IR301]WNS46113.1 MarR family winged helix-turn-helix transcriptional regulator [Paenibacillus sp. MMS20-IR301]